MRKLPIPIGLTLLLFLFGCGKTNDDSEVISQTYTHKYGIDISKKEWEERGKEGKIVTKLETGITMVQNYENGLLHGESSTTFPDSDVIEQLLIFDHGTLVKKIIFNSSSKPIQEEIFDMDNHKTITRWNKDGIPLSMEEYQNDLLTHGEYFNATHECEATISDGTGTRTHRDFENVLLSKDTFQNGMLTHRTTFYPNGTVLSENPYNNYLLHGKQVTYSETGNPTMEATWESGELHGMKYLFAKGIKISEIPYVHGKKHGVEKQFDEKNNLIAEIHWDNNQRHGSSRYFEEDQTKIDWFFRGQEVSLKKFQMMEMREKLLADLLIKAPEEKK